MDFSWAVDYPDLHKVCVMFRQYDLMQPIRYKYKPLPSIMQDGPQCGIVALAMLTEDVTKQKVQTILDEAVLRGYTYNGEMFSAYDMEQLSHEVLTARTIELYDGHLNCNYIVEFLLHGGCMLVPYDSDANHVPCTKHGHKAHWAAVSGAIQTDDTVYVLAKQGKSRNVAIWKLSDLATSNSQLTEFSPDRKLSEIKYKLPVGGIDGVRGLCNKAILIKF